MSTTPDSNNALTTLTLAAKYVNASTTNSADLDRLAMLVNSESHLVNSHVGRSLRRRSLTEYYDGDGGQTLWLDNYPVNTDTTSMQVWAAARSNYATDTDFSTAAKVGTSQIAMTAEKGKLFIAGRRFTAGHRTVKVTYNAGYDTTSASTADAYIPGDLQSAVHELIALKFHRNRSNAINVISKSHDDGAVVYSQEIPWSVRMILDKYRNEYRGEA